MWVGRASVARGYRPKFLALGEIKAGYRIPPPSSHLEGSPAPRRGRFSQVLFVLCVSLAALDHYVDRRTKRLPLGRAVALPDRIRCLVCARFLSSDECIVAPLLPRWLPSTWVSLD